MNCAQISPNGRICLRSGFRASFMTDAYGAPIDTQERTSKMADLRTSRSSKLRKQSLFKPRKNWFYIDPHRAKGDPEIDVETSAYQSL